MLILEVSEGKISIVLSLLGYQLLHEELIWIKPYFSFFLFFLETFLRPSTNGLHCFPKLFPPTNPLPPHADPHYSLTSTPRHPPHFRPPPLNTSVKFSSCFIIFFPRLHFLVIHSDRSVVTRYIFFFSPSLQIRREVRSFPPADSVLCLLPSRLPLRSSGTLHLISSIGTVVVSPRKKQRVVSWEWEVYR